MKNWLDEIRFDSNLDYMLEPDDVYYDHKIERSRVILPYDLEIAQRQWSTKTKKNSRKRVSK
jgi:hypothetical protein